MPDLWADAELIHRYTRAQAIADGVLVDVTPVAKEAGFVWPVAVTQGVWADCVAWSEGADGLQDEQGRLWDVLWMAKVAIRAGVPDHGRLTYQVLRVPNEAGAHKAELAYLVAHAGPGDLAEPVLTIMLPGED